MVNVSRQKSAGRSPKIKIDDEVAFYSIRLAKMGYYGGNPDSIKKAPVDSVLQIINYENFEIDLRAAYKELNDEGR